MGYTKAQRAAKAALKAEATVTAVLGGAAAETYYSPERIEQRAEGKLQATPGVEVVKDSWYQDLDAGKNALDDEVERVREPGFRYRGISPNSRRSGQSRGWEPVQDKDGKAVKVGNLFLGKMPEERAIARNAHYVRQGNEQIQDIKERAVEAGLKSTQDGGGIQAQRGDKIENFRGNRVS